MTTALVTGPTSGIGEGFARRLASDGHDLVLVARDEGRLAVLATELASHGVDVEVLVADLADREQLAEVEARLSDAARPVDVLVNNAGFGLNQPFVGGEVDREQEAIDVMVTAVMRLSHAVAPLMKERGTGTIINVASIAGLLPFGTYSAAKAWVVYFSQALANQLQRSGVKVLVTCPGFVHTEFHHRAGIDMSGSSESWWLSVDDVVDQTFRDLSRGKVLSIPGRKYKGIAAVSHLAPRDTIRRLEGLRRRRIAR
jgi:short-subunit dehydrogenase